MRLKPTTYNEKHVADCYGDSKAEITEPQLIMD